jgi:hypothetical protein
MIDERDLSRERQWFYEERAKAAVNGLQKRHINAQYAPGRREALAAVMEMIPDGATVYRGDSVTLEQVGIIDELRKRTQIKFTDAFVRNEDGSQSLGNEARRQIQREAFLADVFITGTNAVTLDGKLVNIDAMGGRVAALIFGPKKVIVVVGANKIVRDVDEGIERIHQMAAPINARRHLLKHHSEYFADLPCVRTGRCADCNQEWRLCLNTVIIEGSYPPAKGRINVVLVGEELGI